MSRRILSYFLLFLFMVNLCGCAVVVAGGAAGGTAAWLKGKMTHQVNKTPENVLKATKKALESFKFDISKETVQDDVIQVKSNYSDGKTIWIDIRPISTKTSQIDVRVGAVSDKEAAREILDRIVKYL
ncbi:MAG: DUF3568 family protein [Candidatus Omnitrophota bacterium]